MNRTQKMGMALDTPGIGWRGMVSWLGLAVMVRLAAYWWAGPSLHCSYDGCSYLRLAAALAGGEGWLIEKGFLWPPGYPAFLAPLLAGGSDVTAPLARGIQAILGGFLVLPVAALARRVASGATSRPRWAIHAACAFVALDPTLVAYSHLLWPETLFLILFTPAIVYLVSSDGRPLRQVFAGVLLGAAGLVKAIGFWLAIPMAWAASRPGLKFRTRAVLLTLTGALVVIAPWTARNAAVYGRFLFIDATAGTNLYLGNTQSPPVSWDWGNFHRSRVREARPRCNEGDFIQRDRCEQRAAVTWILDNPGWFAARAVTKWADLVNPSSFLVRHVRAGRYGSLPMSDIPPSRALLVTLAAAVPWILLALLAAWGLAMAPASTERRLALGMIFALLALHALTFAMSRFRLPVIPVLAAYAGLAAARLGAREPLLPAGTAPRLALLGTVLALLILWSMRLGPLLDFAPYRGG
jgi:hypothetical protein